MAFWRMHYKVGPTMAFWRVGSSMTRRATHGKPSWMLMWLLLAAGDVERNPGPVRFPCVRCDKAVCSNQDGVQCDGCDKWFHQKCIYMSRELYLQLGRSRAGATGTAMAVPVFEGKKKLKNSVARVACRTVVARFWTSVHSHDDQSWPPPGPCPGCTPSTEQACSAAQRLGKPRSQASGKLGNAGKTMSRKPEIKAPNLCAKRRSYCLKTKVRQSHVAKDFARTLLDRTRNDLKMSIFPNFPGGACPQTHLAGELRSLTAYVGWPYQSKIAGSGPEE